jgi:hypothetical protein
MVQDQLRQKHRTLSEKQNKSKRRGMGQAIEGLPSKEKALSSILSTTKKEGRKERRTEGGRKEGGRKEGRKEERERQREREKERGREREKGFKLARQRSLVTRQSVVQVPHSLELPFSLS